MTSLCRQSSEKLTFSFVETLLQSLWYVTASGANVLFYCQMSGWFLKYILPFFIKLLQEITLNKVLNKQKGKKVFALLHYIRLVLLHIWVICFEHMAAWKGCCDMQKVCGNIFEDHKRCNVQHNLNIHWRFSKILPLYDIYTGICQIF